MHVYFEDWSAPVFLGMLDRNGLEHGGRIIKAFAAAEDPRRALGHPDLATEEVGVGPFKKDETFEYEGRGVYDGNELEALLGAYALVNGGRDISRALFRFSNRHGFCQAAMRARSGDDWLISHPFGEIDGLQEARRDPGREKSIHLDIFFPSSLELLRGIVDYDNPAELVTIKEGAAWRNSQPVTAPLV